VLSFSPAEKGLFIAAVIVAVAFFSWTMYRRLGVLLLARNENRTDRVGERTLAMLKYGFGQHRLPDDLIPGLLHIFIFVGFLTLSIRTMEIAVMGVTSSDYNLYAIPGIGHALGTGYGWLKDIVVAAVLVGVVGFAWRRLVSKPRRMQGLHHAHAILILGWIASLMFADMLLEGGYQAWAAANGVAIEHAGLGSLFTGLFGPESGKATWAAMVWVHTVLVLGFLNYLPFGKHFHVLLAIPNVFFGRMTPNGRLAPILDLEGAFERMDTEPVAIGVSQVEDLSWKQIFDAYACAECGRCVPYCPASSTDKPLSLRDVNVSIRQNVLAKSDFLLAKLRANGHGAAEAAAPGDWQGEALTAGAVGADAIWSCTLCMDCEQRCPVLIEQVPRIVQMRQYLSMIASSVGPEIASFFKNVERNSNPWGLAPDMRADWIAKAAEEDTPVRQFCELSPEEAAGVEYLLFVGCMGSYDDRAQKVTRALCRILNAGGVSYAVLGAEETCCGETARRLGNEYLGQAVISMNIQTMMAHGVKKIIAFCPHCYNTLANEYGDFIPQARAGIDAKDVAAKYEHFERFEVVHATDLVRRLVAERKIILKTDASLGEVAYHDPCFLGRYNGIFDPQRELVELSGGQVKNPSLTRQHSYCCGAGGGRMWMEEHPPRVNTHRFAELTRSCPGAKTIGVSCPLCLTMMLDACKEAQQEETSSKSSPSGSSPGYRPEAERNRGGVGGAPRCRLRRQWASPARDSRDAVLAAYRPDCPLKSYRTAVTYQLSHGSLHRRNTVAVPRP
jgi:Fe-S oxidoreductase